MPIKHQDQCYRTFAGTRWLNLCDVMSDEDQADVDACKKVGARIRLRTHTEGYQQAFYHPADSDLITRTIQARWN